MTGWSSMLVVIELLTSHKWPHGDNLIRMSQKMFLGDTWRNISCFSANYESFFSRLAPEKCDPSKREQSVRFMVY